MKFIALYAAFLGDVWLSNFMKDQKDADVLMNSLLSLLSLSSKRR